MSILQLQQAICFMEEHILEDITYADAAKSVHMSAYSFHRVFSFTVGMTANEYIRNLSVLPKPTGNPSLEYRRTSTVPVQVVDHLKDEQKSLCYNGVDLVSISKEEKTWRSRVFPPRRVLTPASITDFNSLWSMEYHPAQCLTRFAYFSGIAGNDGVG